MPQNHIKLIKKLLYAKSVDLYDHSVLTGHVFSTLINVANKYDRKIEILQEDAKMIGLLHDIGKVYVNDIILSKQESLNSREWDTIRLHPTWGKQFVDGTIFEKYGEYIIQHHENIDGTGYPNKLVGEEIYIESHILNIADQLASLMENRPYRRGIEDKKTLLTTICPVIFPVFGCMTETIVGKTIDSLMLNNNNIIYISESFSKQKRDLVAFF